MKQSPLQSSHCRVNFKYSNSPSRKENIDSLLPVPPAVPLQQNVHKLRHSEFSSSKTSQSAIHTDQTLKKQGHSLQAVTLRKEQKKGENREQTDFLTAHAEAHTLSESAILRQEIRYMRRKLMEAQNIEKELRLEFELYRAGVQHESLKKEQNNQQKLVLFAQIQTLRQQLKEKDQTIIKKDDQKNVLSEQLLQQTHRSASFQRNVKQKQQQNKQLMFQTREMYNEIQMRCQDLNAINQEMLQVTHNNQLFYNQNNFLRETLAQREETISCLQAQRSKEKERSAFLEENVTAQKKEILQLKLKIQESNRQREDLIIKHQADSLNKRQAYAQQITNCRRIYQQKLKLISTDLTFTPIQAHSLSSNQLQKHLSLLKNQPDAPTPQEYFQSRQEIQSMRDQMQLMRITHQQQLQQLRDHYEEQMSANNQEYSQQLMIYMKEVEILVEEMNKMKQKRPLCQEVIQEEPEQEGQYDDEKVRNDLKMYGQDTSQVFMTPPAIKKPSKQQDAHEFMLSEIMDLDAKVNSYIKRRKLMKEENKDGPASDQ